MQLKVFPFSAPAQGKNLKTRRGQGLQGAWRICNFARNAKSFAI